MTPGTGRFLLGGGFMALSRAPPERGTVTVGEDHGKGENTADRIR